jgi:hypothetical protein
VEVDATLRRVERNALLVCAVLTTVACFVPPRPAVALGVLGGGVLVGISYWSLKGGVTALVEAIAAGSTGRATDDAAARRANMRRELVKLTLRYALLALLAYVMIARLRLHPWGLLAGASSVVAGVSLEAVRLVMKK